MEATRICQYAQLVTNLGQAVKDGAAWSFEVSDRVRREDLVELREAVGIDQHREKVDGLFDEGDTRCLAGIRADWKGKDGT